MILERRIAYLIDDDRDVRVSLQMLLRSIGITGWPFASGIDFLEALPHLGPGCLVVDARMAEVDGAALLAELGRQGVRWPAVVITGHGDVRAAVAAMKEGAIDFLEKPFDEADFLEAIGRGFERLSEEVGRVERAAGLIGALTPREREAFDAVLRGETSKELAKRLALSPRTAEMHRARMMKKLNTKRVADVLALALAAGLAPGHRLPEEALQ